MGRRKTWTDGSRQPLTEKRYLRFRPTAKGLAAAREIFGPNFQPSESLKAMVYFDDGDLRTLTKEEKAILVDAVSAVRELPPVAILSSSLAE